MTEDNRVEAKDGAAAKLKRLYPAPAERPLPGLYLCEGLRALIPTTGAFVYANFIVSLDGRSAVSGADTGRLKVPDQTANPRDWSLLLELAAPADAIIIQGRARRSRPQWQALIGRADGSAPSKDTPRLNTSSLVWSSTDIALAIEIVPRLHLQQWRDQVDRQREDDSR